MENGECHFWTPTGEIGMIGDKFNNVPNPVAMLGYNEDKNRNVTLFVVLWSRN